MSDKKGSWASRTAPKAVIAAAILLPGCERRPEPPAPTEPTLEIPQPSANIPLPQELCDVIDKAVDTIASADMKWREDTKNVAKGRLDIKSDLERLEQMAKDFHEMKESVFAGTVKAIPDDLLNAATDYTKKRRNQLFIELGRYNNSTAKKDDTQIKKLTDINLRDGLYRQLEELFHSRGAEIRLDDIGKDLRGIRVKIDRDKPGGKNR